MTTKTIIGTLHSDIGTKGTTATNPPKPTTTVTTTTNSPKI